jgi:hypothetical protein
MKPASSRSRAIRWLGIVVVNLVLLEIASFLAVAALALVSPNHRWDRFLEDQLAGVDERAIASFLRGRYDAELGWENQPYIRSSGHDALGVPWTVNHDADGARVSCLARPAAEQAPLIATYGDSFTHGDEVSDDATWQCALERRLHRRVENHGVGGYGADQALLKIRRHWRQGRIAPITIFAVYEEDLRRALNRYRPFLAPNTDGKLGFKPSFRKIDGTVVLVANPWRPDVATPVEVMALARSLIATDYWATGAARVVPEFPYSIQLLNAGMRAMRRKWVDWKTSGNFWDVPEARDVMLHLLAEFTDGAGHYRTRPVLLMIPNLGEWRSGPVAPSYEAFLREALPKAEPDLLVIDLADEGFDAAAMNLMPFKGHLSPYGNEVIAAAILKKLAAE